MSESTAPEYDPLLVAYHAAFAPELDAAIRRYQFPNGVRVLDCPCGDGFYTAILARCIRAGELVAADKSPHYLDRAKDAVRAVADAGRVRFERADAYRLPFDDNSFDMVWCAQSMISLDDPVRALREMGRVLKPGGFVAVLETDEYHHALLPWPIGLEQAIQRAIREKSQRRYGSGTKLAQSRNLRGLFRDAGLNPTRKTTIVADREAPFTGADREYLDRYFEHLRGFVKNDLRGSDADELARLTSADDPESLLVREDVELTSLATMCHAQKP